MTANPFDISVRRRRPQIFFFFFFFESIFVRLGAIYPT
jgi:hypothetical protein